MQMQIWVTMMERSIYVLWRRMERSALQRMVERGRGRETECSLADQLLATTKLNLFVQWY
jgi:hypothetical protein